MIRIFTKIIIVLTILSYNQNDESKIQINASLYITKTEVGFNIYSNKGILILEYTKQNCDSSSLKTLDEIFETAKRV